MKDDKAVKIQAEIVKTNSKTSHNCSNGSHLFLQKGQAKPSFLDPKQP